MYKCTVCGDEHPFALRNTCSRSCAAKLGWQTRKLRTFTVEKWDMKEKSETKLYGSFPVTYNNEVPYGTVLPLETEAINFNTFSLKETSNNLNWSWSFEKKNELAQEVLRSPTPAAEKLHVLKARARAQKEERALEQIKRKGRK